MVLNDYNCILCNLGTEESLVHLLLASPFVIACWSTSGLTIHQHTDLFVTLASLKDQLHLPFFMKILITMCLCVGPSVRSQCKEIFRKEFAQVILRRKQKFEPFISLCTMNQFISKYWTNYINEPTIYLCQ
jgi:hypothetical protein